MLTENTGPILLLPPESSCSHAQLLGGSQGMLPSWSRSHGNCLSPYKSLFNLPQGYSPGNGQVWSLAT